MGTLPIMTYFQGEIMDWLQKIVRGAMLREWMFCCFGLLAATISSWEKQAVETGRPLWTMWAVTLMSQKQLPLPPFCKQLKDFSCKQANRSGFR